VVGVLTVGRTQLDALKMFADCLDFVQKEVGASTEIEPEPNGYVEIGLADVVSSIKGLVDRSKKHSRPVHKPPRSAGDGSRMTPSHSVVGTPAQQASHSSQPRTAGSAV
jgi:hypothetical protein